MRTARKRKAAGPIRGTSAPDPTREKLIEVAEHVFADRGYQAATIREICVRARANVAAVNYHFGDKLGLYTEVLQQSIRAPPTSPPLPKRSCVPSFELDSKVSAGETFQRGIFAF